MVTEKLILSVERFRYYAGFAQTTDENLLAPMIKAATDVIATNILGKDLVAKLITDYNNDSLTGAYDMIYPSVEQMIIWQAYVYTLPRMAVRISNGQITTGNSENPTADRQAIADLQRQGESLQAHWEGVVKGLLNDHHSEIPELDSSCFGTTDQSSTNHIYSFNNKYSDF